MALNKYLQENEKTQKEIKDYIDIRNENNKSIRNGILLLELATHYY